MRKATKTIISFAVILIAGLNLIVPAFAQDPFSAIAVGGLTGASGAGLFSSMAAASGVDIGYSSTDPLDAMWNVLNPDHVYFSGEKHEATNIGEDVYDYIQVDIGDWLDAQSNFVSQFCQTYNVSDNSSGNVNIGNSYGSLPLNNNGYCILGQITKATGSYNFGGITVNVENTSQTNCHVSATMLNGNTAVWYQSVDSNYPDLFWIALYRDGNTVHIRARNNRNNYVQVTGNVTDPNNIHTNQSTSWQSGTVNLSVFDGWESAKVKIPHSISQLQHDWTPVDFFNELDRIWAGAGEDNIIIEDGAQPVPPQPTPIPDTPLGNVPFDDWVDLWGQGIWSQLENQSDALDFIGSNGTDAIEELESIDENIGALEGTAESIDTNIGIGNGILGGIRSLAQSAVDYLEGIAEHVGELVEEIVAGTETLIAGILNQIPQAFGVIFGPIKQASSIWHYVVEWIQSISAPFQFIWSMASGTSYNIILPVYASLAAAVVLAFFKRFGR